MKKIIFFLLFLLPALSAAAQETYLYAERDTCSLYFDVYRPVPEAQTTFEGKDKPTIIFLFGGGFIQGERNGKYFADWFVRLRENGYTVVSIDYRLGMKGYQVGKGVSGAAKASEQFYKSQQMGIEDLFSAVAFIAENREELGIDPDNLVVAGSSAGAIISVAAEYDIANGHTGNLPEGFNFKGVMSFAGGIISIEGAPEFKSAPCPMLLLHGTADQAVAYKKFGVMGRGIWGSDFLDESLDKKGYRGHSIYRFKDRTHDVAGYMNYLWDIERGFLEQDVMLGHARTIDALVDDPSLPSWGNISTDDIYRKK